MKNKDILNKNPILDFWVSKALLDRNKNGNTHQSSCESGRSMVEMLGVLAVMGVLSVGGIMGYTYAMNRYRTNQVLNEINLMSHLLASTLLNNKPQTLSLESPYDNGRLVNGNYPFEFGCGDSSQHPSMWHTCDADETKFFINIRVPNEICQQIVNSNASFQYQTDFNVNPNCGGTCQLDNVNNGLFWTFDVTQAGTIHSDNPDTPATDCTSDSDCAGNRVCKNGQCNSPVSEDICNGHGSLYDGRYWWMCKCQDGWAGFLCDQPTSNYCGEGRWVSGFCGGTCECPNGKAGTNSYGWYFDCSQTVPECGEKEYYNSTSKSCVTCPTHAADMPKYSPAYCSQCGFQYDGLYGCVENIKCEENYYLNGTTCVRCPDSADGLDFYTCDQCGWNWYYDVCNAENKDLDCGDNQYFDTCGGQCAICPTNPLNMNPLSPTACTKCGFIYKNGRCVEKTED